MRFIIPLCDLFFWDMTPYILMGWKWVLQKNKFSSSEKLFLSHIFEMFPIHEIGFLRNFAFWFFSLCLGCKGLDLPWIIIAKKIFFIFWKIVFLYYSYKIQINPILQKILFKLYIFFIYFLSNFNIDTCNI